MYHAEKLENVTRSAKFKEALNGVQLDINAFSFTTRKKYLDVLGVFYCCCSEAAVLRTSGSFMYSRNVLDMLPGMDGSRARRWEHVSQHPPPGIGSLT